VYYSVGYVLFYHHFYRTACMDLYCNFDLRNSAWGWGVNAVVAAFLQRAARHGRAFMHRCMDREGGCKILIVVVA